MVTRTYRLWSLRALRGGRSKPTFPHTRTGWSHIGRPSLVHGGVRGHSCTRAQDDHTLGAHVWFMGVFGAIPAHAHRMITHWAPISGSWGCSGPFLHTRTGWSHIGRPCLVHGGVRGHSCTRAHRMITHWAPMSGSWGCSGPFLHTRTRWSHIGRPHLGHEDVGVRGGVVKVNILSHAVKEITRWVPVSGSWGPGRVGGE